MNLKILSSFVVIFLLLSKGADAQELFLSYERSQGYPQDMDKDGGICDHRDRVVLANGVLSKTIFCGPKSTGAYVGITKYFQTRPISQETLLGFSILLSPDLLNDVFAQALEPNLGNYVPHDIFYELQVQINQVKFSHSSYRKNGNIAPTIEKLLNYVENNFVYAQNWRHGT